MSLVAITVSQAARGNKLGTRLMRAFEKQARELHMRSLRLSTRTANARARKLFEACGWRPFATSEARMYYFLILSSVAGPDV
jgi:ribosomal protein S18 acetylase RimI-like enzyme